MAPSMLKEKGIGIGFWPSCINGWRFTFFVLASAAVRACERVLAQGEGSLKGEGSDVVASTCSSVGTTPCFCSSSSEPSTIGRAGLPPPDAAEPLRVAALAAAFSTASAAAALCSPNPPQNQMP